MISAFQALATRIADDGGIIRWDFYSINPTPWYRTQASLVCIDSYPDEGFDCMGLQDDFSYQLVDNVASICSNTIVIIHSAGMSPMFIVSKFVPPLPTATITNKTEEAFVWLTLGLIIPMSPPLSLLVHQDRKRDEHS